MQHVGIILTVENPVTISTIRQAINSIDGTRIIYVTVRNNRKLYIVDQEGMQQ